MRPSTKSESKSTDPVRDLPTRRSNQLRWAISRWENEGGAGAGPPDDHSTCGSGQTSLCLTNAELVQLQVRMIALENLVTALLAGAPEEVTALVRELAACISPRPGYTPHHLTIHAASQMIHLAQRAELFRIKAAPPMKAERS